MASQMFAGQNNASVIGAASAPAFTGCGNSRTFGVLKNDTSWMQHLRMYQEHVRFLKVSTELGTKGARSHGFVNEGSIDTSPACVCGGERPMDVSSRVKPVGTLDRTVDCESGGLGFDASVIVHGEIKTCKSCNAVRETTGMLKGVSSVQGGAPHISRVDDGEESLLIKLKIQFSIRTLAIAVFFGGLAGFMHALLSTLPQDFWNRWRLLIDDRPTYDDKNLAELPSETVVYDCYGVIIATFSYGSSNFKGDHSKRAIHLPLNPSDIPSAMWQAVIASEDRRFFQHRGIDPKGVSRAVLSLTTSGGGSTITQQVSSMTSLCQFQVYRSACLECINISFQLRESGPCP